MTKKERVARAQCPESPTGQHVFVMSWPEPRTYIGTCRYCNEVRHEDATLGVGQTTQVGRYARGTTVMMAGSHAHIRERCVVCARFCNEYDNDGNCVHHLCKVDRDALQAEGREYERVGTN